MRLKRRMLALGLAVFGLVIVGALPCEAAGKFTFNRATWDLAMRLINFGILAFLIVKYGRKPLTNYLRGQSENVAARFQELDEERRKLEKLQAQQDELLAGLDAKIEELKKYYHEVGEDEKRRILARAEETRRFILADAEAAARREFEEAKKRFRVEVIEMAVNMAEERIKKKITKNDQKKLVKKYLGDLSSVQSSVHVQIP